MSWTKKFDKEEYKCKEEKMYYLNETGCSSDEREWIEVNKEEVKNYIGTTGLFLYSKWEHGNVTGLMFEICEPEGGIPGLFIPLSRLDEFSVSIEINK